MCISQSVRKDYLNWQLKEGFSHPLTFAQVGYFYLGAEFEKSDPVIRLLDENQPFFIVVGSLEPRKNHTKILDAFELLWAKNVSIRLAIVGAFGWKSEELLKRILSHPLLGTKLFLIRDASDRDLVALYKSTAGLIVASLAEGFGLPIIEAQKHGANVICSDIPVFREIGGSIPHYFPPQDHASLASLIENNFIDESPANEIRKDNREKHNSWLESSKQLINGIQNILTPQK